MMRPLDMLRVALGLIMVPTALAYFLPDLLPWVRTAQWEGDMTVRLMGQLDASGLLAVAKFIQLVGGLALLLNRVVPFALAAMAAVNVCGAFVAVLIEGDPALGAMALGVLALNTLLMFAHLPAYAGVLSTDAIADGESTEPGANYESLFAHPFGDSVPRATLVPALVVLLAAAWFFWKVVLGLNSLTGLVVLAFPVLVLIAKAVRSRS